MANIYILTNLTNGRQYVGQTVRDLKKRIAEHKNNKGIYPISVAIKKYGISNFKIVSFSCPEENLDWNESLLIKELNTLVPNGYNLESGGHKNKNHSEKTKEKISKSLKGKMIGEKNPMYKIGDMHPMFGRHHSEESNKKNKISHLGKLTGKDNPMYGVQRLGKENSNFGQNWTQEQKDKQSKLTKEKMNNKEIRDKMRKNHADFSGEKNPNSKRNREKRRQNND